MILFFHLIFFITKYIVKSLSKSLSTKKDGSESETISNYINCTVSSFSSREDFSNESRYLDNQLKFFPPVYVQRYEAVYLILQEPPWKDTIKKIADFGCSEMGFFLYLKHLPGVDEILEIDIDEDVLMRYASKAAPLHSDYLICKRSKPLNVLLLAGDIAEYDDTLSGTDVVVAIEVIEHLMPETLKKMPHNIFHNIQPRLAVFTTPNSDFNPLFPNSVGFRHPDHKFEWSRKEFFMWTREIIKNYPNYSVKFYGVGVGPEGTENLGCCSQMAVFERLKIEDKFMSEPQKEIHNYKLIRKYDFPFFVDKRSNEEKITDEVIYRIKFSMDTSNYFNSEDSSLEVPLCDLMEYVSEWCSTEEELKSALINRGHIVEEKNEQFHLLYEESHQGSYEDLSVELNCELSKIEDMTEVWDWEDSNCSTLSGKFLDEELPNFLSARSLRSDNSPSVKEPDTPSSVVENSVLGETTVEPWEEEASWDRESTLIEPAEEDKSKTSTPSKIPRKCSIVRKARKISKNSKTLKSWIQSRLGL